MKILALEFSSDHRSVAVHDAEAPAPAGLEACVVEAEGRATRACAMMDAVLGQAGWGRDAVGALAVGLGPGSYTGIRVTLALAEGWRLARPVRLIGVGSFDCLAAQARAARLTDRGLVAMDAQRGEFYVAEYELSAAGWHAVDPVRLATRSELEERRRTADWIVGPDLAALFPEARTMYPSATMVARLAADRLEGQAEEVLEPIYLRAVSFVKAPPPRLDS